MEDKELPWQAGKCLKTLLSSMELSEFGFRIQALAAHVLLRLGLHVTEINTQGHPDIVAESVDGIIRIEVEADTYRMRPRKLTPEDLNGLTPRGSNEKGYFALALCGPFPEWLIVDYARLIRRRGFAASPAVLRALSDSNLSRLWTNTFIELLTTNYQNLPYFSYRFLVQRALKTMPL